MVISFEQCITLRKERMQKEIQILESRIDTLLIDWGINLLNLAEIEPAQRYDKIGEYILCINFDDYSHFLTESFEKIIQMYAEVGWTLEFSKGSEPYPHDSVHLTIHPDLYDLFDFFNTKNISTTLKPIKEISETKIDNDDFNLDLIG